MLQEKLFEVTDVILFIKQNDALLVLNFVHASVGEGAEVISKQDRVPRVDDRRVVSGIKHGLEWKDAPEEYGPHKTLYNRFIRWSRLGVFNKIFTELANQTSFSCGPLSREISLFRFFRLARTSA